MIVLHTLSSSLRLSVFTQHLLLMLPLSPVTAEYPHCSIHEKYLLSSLFSGGWWPGLNSSRISSTLRRTQQHPAKLRMLWCLL